MIIQKDVHLAPKTTMKIGGYADTFYIPETEDDLIHIVQEIYDKKQQLHILSGGSNLLINDNRRFEDIIYMSSACLEMYEIGDGKFYIGASNRIQNVITFVNGYEYGGFEGLVGLPALFGGIIYMNAGIGGRDNSLFTIGNFIDSVRVWDLDNKEIAELPAEQCEFSHRYSVFHKQRYIILGATIHCKNISCEESKRVKAERIKYCKERFEYGKGCFGTCFSKASYKILKLVSLCYKLGEIGKKKVTFAKNNKNWLVNHGDGRYKDAIRIINSCKLMHKLCRREIKCEVVIWE